MSGDSSEIEEVSYDELYASVLDLYRPIALNGDTSAVPSNLSTEEAYSTNTIFEANRVGEKVQYSYVDINDDGSAEVLIDTMTVFMHYIILIMMMSLYLPKVLEPLLSLSTMKYYKDGTFNQLQSVDFSISETTDGASKVSLGDVQTLDLFSEDWYDFDDSSSDNIEESSSNSKSSKETGIDIDAI